MAQPLKSSAPAFILGCMTTDNKFTAEHVLKRWSHIYSEFAKELSQWQVSVLMETQGS